MIIAALSTVTLLIGYAFIFIMQYIKNKKKLKTELPFKASMDLVDLPVITVKYKEYKLNMLLDTGSNDSYISSSAAKRIGLVATKLCQTSVTGYGKESFITQPVYDIEVGYKDNVLNIELLQSEELDYSFETIKKSSGVSVDGIIGSKFLDSNDYIIDFKDYIAYRK